MAWHAFNQGNKATKTEEGGGWKNVEKGRENRRGGIGGLGTVCQEIGINDMKWINGINVNLSFSADSFFGI